MANVERTLVAQSEIQSVAGHSLHKGTPREIFIREFLQNHLPANLAIGTGEIIDSESIPGAPRNQFDIVVYRSSFPKLHLGGGIDAFLIESVVATIEVKSTLTQAELESAAKAAYACKSLKPNISRSIQTGFVAPAVLNYVVAYDGPAQMQTVAGWIPAIYRTLSIASAALPTDEGARLGTPSPAIDGIFVLRKGGVYFDNTPIGLATPEMRQQNPNAMWFVIDSSEGALLLLFLFLQTAVSNLDSAFLNPIPYVANARFQSVSFV